MFSKAFSNPNRAYWSIQGAGIIWILGSYFLLRWYEVPISEALLDAAIFGGFFQISITVLDRIFSFYLPKKGSIWILLILPILLSSLSVFTHYWILSWVFDQNETYLELLQFTWPLRFALYWPSLILVTLLAIVVAKLEQQNLIRERENMMQELSKEAELSQLRQQLQPHFLFNSLNSINALVVSKPEKVREMVLQLSDFLRGTIRKDSQQWLTVEEELNYLQLYLDIEKVRFGHRLQVNFEIHEEAKKLKIPQLLLQPLLENAIKYGLYGTTEDVRIWLKAHRNNNYLELELVNPFDPTHSSEKGTGFGLSSVDRRLFLLFGRKDLLQFGPEKESFHVSLKIPQLK
ncbi:sensor histidine kinase [Algoriphagus namhaensis]